MPSLGLALAGCDVGQPPSAPDQATVPVVFTEVAAQSGIGFAHRNGAAGRFLLPEIMGGGAGWLDFDGDGLLDAYLVQSAGPDGNRLYRNRGDGTFEDVTAAAGVGDTGYGMGCAAGDYDNDGDVDLFVTNLGPDVLYRNDGGGTFTDVTAEAGAGGGGGWSTSAAFVDYDADGDLDLFVTSYVDWQRTPRFLEHECFALNGARDYCSPQSYQAPSADTLFRNEGDGTFRDVSEESGIAGSRGTGLGVVCTDLDLDGRIDIYVANDQMPSFAWINLGGGRFEERAVPLGVAVDEAGRSQAGMGVDSADVDDDGDFDLWKVHLDGETHILYVNRGSFFDDATIRWGLSLPTRRFTGFGTSLLDYDLDGLLDLFIANGRVQYSSTPFAAGDVYAEPNQLMRQVAPGRFEDVSDDAGPALALVESSRAAAFGDYDNDGDVDVLVANCNGPARLLRNDAPRSGGFLTLRLLTGGRDAYGALVRCHIGDTVRTDEVRAAYSYCATNDPRLHIGLGDAGAVDRVEIRWPDGTQQTAGPFEAGRSVVIQLTTETRRTRSPHGAEP